MITERKDRKERRDTLKSTVIKNALIALSYIDNAHKALALAIKDEKGSGVTSRHDVYDYGLSNVNFHKVKLANVKKAIMSITGNRRYQDIEELEPIA